jgi:hypothetical protein
MEIGNIKGLIESKLACIDILNKRNGRCEISVDNKLAHELTGIKQALDLMGFRLEINRNPYYYEDGKPSTFTVTLNG